MGPEETGTRRLNFAQSFNPIGSIMGVVLSKLFILSHLNQANAEQRAAMSPKQLQHIQIVCTFLVIAYYGAVACRKDLAVKA